MTTIKDIADIVGVSTATVSYVLNGKKKVSKETELKVMQAVKQMDYTPNLPARSLRKNKTNLIGLVVPDIRNPFYPDLAKGCEDCASQNGYDLLVYNSDDQHEKTNRILDKLAENRVDGILIASAREGDQERISRLLKKRYPVVLAHRRLENIKISEVTTNQVKAALNVTNYIIQNGHRNIVFIKGVDGSSINADRTTGFLKAIRENKSLISKYQFIDNCYTYSDSYIRVKELFKDNKQFPTAIVAYNDLVAYGAMDAVADLGLTIPEDVSIVGFDDLIFSSNRRIKLTTVSTPRYEIGKEAMKLLINMIEEDNSASDIQRIVLDTELMVRGTVSISKK